MSLERRNYSQRKQSYTNCHVQSSVIKQWQVYIDQQKEQTSHGINVDNYLQSEMPPINQASSPKIKNGSHFFPSSHFKERSINKRKRFTRTKKKTLFIEDSENKHLRNTSNSLQILKNKSTASCNNSKTISPQRRSLHKMAQKGSYEPILHTQSNQRHHSMPTHKRQIQAFTNNQYIKRILKKYQKQSQTLEEQQCVSSFKSSLPTEFQRYSQVQCPRLELKSVFLGKRYNKVQLQTRMRPKIHSKLNHSEFISGKANPKHSTEISPWQIPQEES